MHETTHYVKHDLHVQGIMDSGNCTLDPPQVTQCRHTNLERSPSFVGLGTACTVALIGT
uniref:Uncharacterized protein n=1 Tax=Anguilla anguilla TaxID=7936 RepID=A0A0E9W4N2_ANGAN